MRQGRARNGIEASFAKSCLYALSILDKPWKDSAALNLEEEKI